MRMMTCPNCGQPISPMGHQCPYCNIRIVGASGLSKMMRQVGNAPFLMGGGLFLMAFFVCTLLLWKVGLTGSSENIAMYSAHRPEQLSLALAGISGKWSGKFISTLGDSGDVALSVQEEANRSVTGRWNGASLERGKRVEDNQLVWECDHKGRLWRFTGRLSENSQLLIVTFQTSTEDGGVQTGAAFLTLEAKGSSDAETADLSGVWTGLYSSGRLDGVTTVSLKQDRSGTLSGIWNGARLAQGERAGPILTWECNQGPTHFQILGEPFGNGKKLVLIFSASEGSDGDRYTGSALYTKNR